MIAVGVDVVEHVTALNFARTFRQHAIDFHIPYDQIACLFPQGILEGAFHHLNEVNEGKVQGDLIVTALDALESGAGYL